MSVVHGPNPGPVINTECMGTLKPCPEGSCVMLQAGLLTREEVAERCGVLVLAREKAIEHYRATHDMMTGLLNKDGFFETIRNLTPGPYIAIYADGTATKDINDKIGHDNGDRAIIGIADILRTVDSTAILAREGGDEFWMIVMPDTSGRPPEETMEELIKQCIAETTRFMAANPDLTEENPKLVDTPFNLAVGGTIWKVGKERLWKAKRRAEKHMYAHKEAQGGGRDERRKKNPQKN